MRYKSYARPFSLGQRGSKLQLMIRGLCYEESYFVTDYFYSCICKRAPSALIVTK